MFRIVRYKSIGNMSNEGTLVRKSLMHWTGKLIFLIILQSFPIRILPVPLVF
jgi:hypothetical protein